MTLLLIVVVIAVVLAGVSWLVGRAMDPPYNRIWQRIEARRRERSIKRLPPDVPPPPDPR